MHLTRPTTLERLAPLMTILLAACMPSPASGPPTPTNTGGPPASASAESRGTGETVLLAAGDVADCKSGGDETTAALLDTLLAEDEANILALGDLAYESGTAEEFANCYAPSWGRHRSLTIPTPGNHEYETPGAAPYFAYFGGAGLPGEGWHVRGMGNWTLVALNSNCDEIGGCGPGSAQVRWLSEVLGGISGPGTCTLAFWHHPRWSSGAEHGSDPRTDKLWRLLYEAGADLVLSGHDHQYERFAPMDSAGAANTDGMVQFVVGTGGRSLYEFADILPTSAAHDNSTYGLLKLNLHPASYDWEFVPTTAGGYTDSGSADCR